MYAKLTPREEEVYYLLVTTTLKKAEIAKELCLTIGTINTHVNSIFQKMEVNSVKELIIKYYNELFNK